MTRLFDKYWLKPSIAQQMKERALFMCQSGNFPLAPELGGMKIVEACRAQYEQKELITLLIFTMDKGMHTVGWWKNPDWEQCYHLSLTYWYPDGRTAPNKDKETNEWLHFFFDPHTNWIWAEPPYSPDGKKRNVWHYRLFTDAHWQPILPQGEVYSKLKTELHWLSYSDLNYEINKKRE